MTSFDGVVFLLILMAAIFSREPKKSAIGIVCIALCGVVISYTYLDGILSYYIAAMIESTAAVVIMMHGKLLDRSDRIYFRVMSSFLLASSLITISFSLNIIVLHASYVLYSEAITIAHILAITIMSDGVKNGMDFIRSFVRSRLHSAGR